MGRWALMLVVGAVMAGGCGKKACSACTDDAAREVCEDTIQICNLLGPPGFPFRESCVDDANDVCENGGSDTDCDSDDTDVCGF